MRWTMLVAALSLMLASFALTTTVAADPAIYAERADHFERIAKVAQDLIDAPEIERQAAGLLLWRSASAWHVEHPTLMSERELRERLDRLIAEADSGLARALLAQLCSNKKLHQHCRDQGLDRAIVEQDGAELFARLYLTETHEEERLREVLIAAEALDERAMDFALILLDGIEARYELELDESHAIIHALQMGPALGPTGQLCQQAIDEDPELDQACESVHIRMASEPGSMIFNLLGASVLARRAEAKGEPKAMARHEQWREDHHAWQSCAYSAGEAIWEAMNADWVRAYLRHWQRHGEASAIQFIAEQGESDCGPAPRSPWAMAANP
jgi:hypothetical protein